MGKYDFVKKKGGKKGDMFDFDKTLIKLLLLLT